MPQSKITVDQRIEQLYQEFAADGNITITINEAQRRMLIHAMGDHLAALETGSPVKEYAIEMHGMLVDAMPGCDNNFTA
jgi:hypothetical protein